jgi:hypothetical protein
MANKEVSQRKTILSLEPLQNLSYRPDVNIKLRGECCFLTCRDPHSAAKSDKNFLKIIYPKWKKKIKEKQIW